MLRVDGAYLFSMGANLRSINKLAEEDTVRSQLLWELLGLKGLIEEFVIDSVFSNSFKTAISSAKNLTNEIDAIIPPNFDNVNWEEVIPTWRIKNLKRAFDTFDAIITASLQTSDLYFASPKGGYDTACLTDHGEVLFPTSLAKKVPDAVPDVRAGARCLAFDLPTAAGFHFHRANEAVLRRYFDEVAGEANRPDSRNMGDYINIMKTKKVGDPKVIDVLRSLKDLHRNPLMHPDQNIDSIEDTISLLSAIRAAIGYMLDRIPDSVSAVIAPLDLGEALPKTVE